MSEETRLTDVMKPVCVSGDRRQMISGGRNQEEKRREKMKKNLSVMSFLEEDLHY